MKYVYLLACAINAVLVGGYAAAGIYKWAGFSFCCLGLCFLGYQNSSRDNDGQK